MLALILFLILLYQFNHLEKILKRYPEKNPEKVKRNLYIGMWALGTLALLQIVLNIWLNRSLWSADIISPFFNGFEKN